MPAMLLLGYDVGSSSVKAALLEAATGRLVARAASPETEMPILAPRPGRAEQHPDTWWEHLCAATAKLRAEVGDRLRSVAAVGLASQMHGLVAVDAGLVPVRPVILWCDSRAVELGAAAFAAIGPVRCLTHHLNSPGNFTASKLAWVKAHEPDVYRRIRKVMLPGDYLVLRMTGELSTTVPALSEGILWDFVENGVARLVLEHYGLSADLLPPIVPTFGRHGALTPAAAAALGLPAGTPVTYRAGDQPNNALALKVLEAGEVAATAGTSGVIYGVLGHPAFDPASRVNVFAHVNHAPDRPRYGAILCVNATGILNGWLRREVFGSETGYAEMNRLAERAPVGSAGLAILPYGNGAERTLGNRRLGASLHGLDLTIHSRAHLARAAQEGIAFALRYGIGILREMGLRVGTVRAGHANMFLSPVFGEAFATTTGCRVELYATDGAQGAARGAGIGAGLFADPAAAYEGLRLEQVIDPDMSQASAYLEAYRRWRALLDHALSHPDPAP